MSNKVRKSIAKYLLGALVVFLSACATVYTAPEFATYQAKHKTLAILPPIVSINAQSFKPGTSVELINSQQLEEAQLFYGQLYSQFLAQQGKGRYTITFQDIEETKSILVAKGVTAEKMRAMTRAQIGQTLGVDAVVSSRIYRDKPMSNGAALFGLLLGVGGITNEVQINLSVHESMEGRLVWNYDHIVGGGVVNSAEGMAKSLMKSISKKFPYEKKK
jgi:hypothetical protein